MQARSTVSSLTSSSAAASRTVRNARSRPPSGGGSRPGPDAGTIRRVVDRRVPRDGPPPCWSVVMSVPPFVLSSGIVGKPPGRGKGGASRRSAAPRPAATVSRVLGTPTAAPPEARWRRRPAERPGPPTGAPAHSEGSPCPKTRPATRRRAASDGRRPASTSATGAAREAQRVGLELAAQAQRRFSQDVRMYPDLLLRRDGHDAAVADAKYKEPDNGQPVDDLYQMLAYCVTLGLPAGLLIYGGPHPLPHQIVRRAGIRIELTGIDLSLSWRDVLFQAREVAARFAAHAEPATSRGGTRNQRQTTERIAGARRLNEVIAERGTGATRSVAAVRTGMA